MTKMGAQSPRGCVAQRLGCLDTERVVLWCMLLCVVQHPAVVLANPDPALPANALTYCFWTKEGACCLGICICHVLPTAKANPSPASQRWCRCHCAPTPQTCTWHCHCSLPYCCCSEPGHPLPHGYKQHNHPAAHSTRVLSSALPGIAGKSGITHPALPKAVTQHSTAQQEGCRFQALCCLSNTHR